MRSRRFKRGLAYVFIALGGLAAVLNSIAAVLSARDGKLVVALLYVVIAVTIGTTAFIGWYVMNKQRPYRWRNGPDS